METIPNEVLDRLRSLIRQSKTGELTFQMKDGAISKGSFKEFWPIRP